MKQRRVSGLKSLGRGKSKKTSKPGKLQFERLEPRVVLSSQPVITEILASNNSALLDGDGNSSDWIEIYNPTEAAIDLTGWHLTDDSGALGKWNFPATTLESQDYLVVFASGQLTETYVDTDGNLHTNFNLSADGEYLALTDASETIVHEFSPEFPSQRTDISYGISQGTQTLVGTGDQFNYHVPTSGSLGTTWTGTSFDDSSWLGGASSGTILITELHTSSPDWVEIQNVSDSTVDTTGWSVAFNNSNSSNINQVYPYYWNFASSMTSGQVLFTNEDQNGVGDISWSANEPGWTMILDDTGQVQDFTVWGYSTGQIESFDTTVNGFNITSADLPWSGAAVSGISGGSQTMRRSGSADNNNASDFAFGGSSNQGSQNPGITIPFSTATSGAKLGAGFETNPTGGSGELMNHAPNGTTTQSSVSFGGVADNAIDGNYGNFTHTAAGQDLPSWWQVDLGDVLAIEQIVAHNRDSCCQSRFRDITIEVLDASDSVLWTSGLLNPENVLAGPETLDMDLLALNGGNPVFGQKVRITRTPDPDLSGTGGAGNNDEADVLSLGEVEVFARDLVSYEQIYQTDLEADLFNQNSTVYMRVPFDVSASPANFDQLQLNMQYDDGFVAYLNGTLVASRNAPGVPAFNSTATSERADEDAVQVETIDITPYLGSLVQGENILAIHGLNLTAGDEDFLIVPELVGVSTSSSFRFFETPTPGAPNNIGLMGFVGDTAFSVDRGFYDTSFQVEITSSTPGAEIYYTTNGDVPTQSTGMLYNGALTISETTALRAAAFKDDYFPSNVDTQTYIFLKDVVSQDYQATLDAGFPTSWGGTSPDYGLDPDVIGNFDASGNPTGGDDYGGLYANTIQDDLQSLPTISIVMNTEDLFGSNGIYTNSTQHGVAWERASSVEWITPDGSQEFQVDAGIRIQGGAFRSHGLSKKHSFRLLFKEAYGPTKLNYPLFGEGAVDQFNTIVLRAGANDGYTWSSAIDTEQYTRDEFGRSLQRASGNPGAHSNFAHLYINGIYWGLYNPTERPDNEFGASYVSGDADNWDSIHVGETPSGDSVAWNAMFSKTAQAGSSLAAYMELQGKNIDGTPDPSTAPLLDLENYIDYIALNVWGGNWDWPFKNYWAGRDRDPATTTGFQFFTWDFENTMGNNRGRSPLNAKTLDQNFTGSRNAGQPHTNLKSSEEYRMYFADRIHEFFFNDGILTPDSLIDRYQVLSDSIERSIVAESARWGDTKHSTPQTLAEWKTEQSWILNTYLPQRSDIVMQEFKDYDLYPDTVAPSFSQHGGHVSSGFHLTVTAPAGTIYYTLDGSDPRAIGGAVSSSAMVYTGSAIDITEGTTVRARALSGGEWSAVNQADFIVATPADATNLRITELYYNPHDANPVPGLNELVVDNDQFEFVELRNISAQPIDLAGVEFVEVPDGSNNEGIEFTFAQQVLAPGEHILIVRNQAAFESRFGAGFSIAGEYSGSLSNGGELITLRDSGGIDIQSFEYNDSGSWPGRADGTGSSLEIVDTAGDYNSADNWRSSSEFGGSPLVVGNGPVQDVIVNEVLSHSQGVSPDLVELYNSTGSSIDLSNWYLSDTNSNLYKYQIAASTMLGAGQYLVFNESQLGFALDGQFGEDVWLIEADATTGAPLRFADHVEFDATDTDVSLGRWNNGDPDADLFPMISQTFGSANSGPVTSEVVISEVNYSPAPVPAGEVGNITQEELEFIEIANTGSSPADISSWRVEGINYRFPDTTTLAADEAIVVVTFDPALEPAKATAFRNVFGIGAGPRLFGPASGQLNNAGERVELLRPESPTLLTGDILVDAVRYDDLAPWPTSADGGGDSLQRTAANDYGGFVSSWQSAAGNPGSTSFVTPASGDFDGDGDNDGADFLAWQRGYGITGGASPSDGDANGDGNVDALDLDVWQSQFGSSSPLLAASQVVVSTQPESAPVVATANSADHSDLVSIAAMYADATAENQQVAADLAYETYSESPTNALPAELIPTAEPATQSPTDEVFATLEGEEETLDEGFGELSEELFLWV